MRYLIIETDNNIHYLIDELTEFQLVDSKNLAISIFDLELRLFHVSKNTWQKIPEK